MANSTANTIMGLAYGLAKVDSTTISTPALQTTQMLQWLNDANAEYRELFRISGEPSEAMKREESFTLSSSTTLVDDTGEGDVSITLTSSTILENSGAFVIWDNEQIDIAEFTDNDSGSGILTGVSGLDWNHSADDVVEKIYALPSDFDDFRATEESPHGVLVGSVPYMQTSAVPTGTEFNVYDNGTTKYLVFPKNSSGKVYVAYNRASTTIDETGDVVDVPVKHQSFLVYRLVAHIKRVQREYDSAQLYDKMANDAVYLAQRTKNTHKIIRTRTILRKRWTNNPQVTPLDNE